jgi:DNA uptake protein ComE-like DNA-binding protein
VERSLADSKVEAVSTDLRFIAAFSAALTLATTVLRASGHRTATQAGHHAKTIESLELTVKASPKLIQRFKTFNNKRNKSSYDVAGAVSDQELEAMVKLATELKDSTVAWLQKFHPELLKA